VLVAAAAQAALRLAALLLSVASGIIIARRLPPVSYAAYQAAMKRASLITSLPLILVGFWGYRYAAAGRRGALAASAILSLAAGCAAGLVAAWLVVFLGGGPLLAVAAAAAIALYTLYDGLGRALTALRAVRVEASRLAYRLVYASLVVALVYLAGLGGVGAAAAVLAGSAAGLALLARWLRLRPPRGRGVLRAAAGLLGEWLHGSWIPAAYWLTSLLYGLDVVVAGLLLGGARVAAFFAAASLASLSMEAAVAAAVHVQAHVLRTGDEESGYSVAMLVALVSAPIYAYMAVRPEQVIALMNPRYVYAAGCLAAYSAAAYTATLSSCISQVVQGLDRSTASSPGPIIRGAAYTGLAGAALYAALLPPLLSSTHSLTAWALLLLASRLVQLAGLLAVAARNGHPVPRRVLARPPLYLAAAAAAAQLLAPVGYRASFMGDALLAAAGFIPSSAAYACVVVALDPWARRLAARALERLSRLTHP